ncbi:MAG TPA: hypothetical protein VE196_00225, partial [Pseudonocardiaceae bacterium]|nr:hypothetical protein [Pseudonocardiaceae bacterium]
IHLAISMDRETPVVPAAQGHTEAPQMAVEPLNVPVWQERTPVTEVFEVEPSTEPAPRSIDLADPVTELIKSGAGRRRIARELGVSEHAARKLIEERAA